MSRASSSDKEADPELYIADCANMIRDILRALAATDKSTPLANASRRLRNLVANADHLPPTLNWYQILDGAMEQLRLPHGDWRDHDYDYNALSRKCLKYFAEATTSDGLSAARIGTARRAIPDEIKSIENLRELRRAEYKNDNS